MSRFCLTMGWSDAPHLTEQQKKDMGDALPPHQRDARSKGIPQLGAGAIYPVSESDVVVPDFEIPVHWPRVYSLDVGWNRTAALWGAWDRENDIVYLYGEHYRGQAEPSIHAQAIKARGDWIHGVIDPASRGRSQHDGAQLLETYVELGLKIEPADNARETGIYKVWERLSSGRLKAFQSLNNWRTEFRLYRRDEKGHVVKENDHLMDCLAPETKVITENGSKSLAELVGTSGKVLTIDGRFVEYVECGKTRVNTEMIKLSFEDGAEISCTPDHLIMSEHGWLPALEMLGKKAYKVVQCESKLSPKHAKNTTEQNTISKYVACVSVVKRERMDTYCLRVPETQAFAVESGIIVHNCLRYLVMSGLDIAKTKPVEKPKVHDKYSSDGGGTGSGWMA